MLKINYDSPQITQYHNIVDHCLQNGKFNFQKFLELGTELNAECMIDTNNELQLIGFKHYLSES